MFTIVCHMTSRTLKHLPLDDLTPNPVNPKAHTVDVIDDSVSRFGYVDPIVVDERTGYMVSGHGRRETLLRMKERGADAPEGVIVDDDGRWSVPVVGGWASKSDGEAQAALIALNRTSELGGWDEPALVELLEQLADDDALSGVGYTDDDVRSLRYLLDGGQADASPQQLEPAYRVMIEVDDERQQAELLERFEQEGLRCSAVML